MKQMITQKIINQPLKTICKRYASSSSTIISDLIGNDTKNTLNTNMFQQEKVTDGHTKLILEEGNELGCQKLYIQVVNVHYMYVK